jgi:hypothetical protein
MIVEMVFMEIPQKELVKDVMLHVQFVQDQLQENVQHVIQLVLTIWIYQIRLVPQLALLKLSRILAQKLVLRAMDVLLATKLIHQNASVAETELIYMISNV